MTAIACSSVKRQKVQILNVDFDDITMDELVEEFAQGLLLTVHVDMIMKLQKDRAFRDIVSKFDVVTCDSQILYFASKFLGRPLRERVSGSDFFPRYYMKHRDDASITVFMCGGKEGVAAIAGRRINEKVGREMVVGTYAPPFDFDKRPEEIDRMISLINDSRATVLVVGLAAGRQEKFIIAARDRLPCVHTFLPLGGTIDYESETLVRPPAWITTCGLEWLYRLLKEPRQRWHRYLVHQPPVLWLLFLQRLGLYRNPL